MWFTVNAHFYLPGSWGRLYQFDLWGFKIEKVRSVMWALHDYVTDAQQNPGHQGSGERPWLVTFCTCCHTLLLWELNTFDDSTERGQLGASALVLLNSDLCAVFSDFNPCTVANCNYEYNNLSELCESFLQIRKPERSLENLQHGNCCHFWKMHLMLVPT